MGIDDDENCQQNNIGYGNKPCSNLNNKRRSIDYRLQPNFKCGNRLPIFIEMRIRQNNIRILKGVKYRQSLEPQEKIKRSKPPLPPLLPLPKITKKPIILRPTYDRMDKKKIYYCSNQCTPTQREEYESPFTEDKTPLLNKDSADELNPKRKEPGNNSYRDASRGLSQSTLFTHENNDELEENSTVCQQMDINLEESPPIPSSIK